MKFLIALFYSLSLFAAEKSIPETLGIDPQTTKGEIELIALTEAAEKEKITLGTEGRYGLGLVIRNKDLPERYKKELKGTDVLQFILGNTTAGLAPQFGALTLMTKNLTKKKQTFSISLPDPAAPSYEGSALLLFTSPKNPAAQSNEEKLKKTFFSREGTIIVSTLASEPLEVTSSNGTKLTFERRRLRLDLSAELSTPFNPVGSALKGWLDIPLLVPKNSKTADFVTRYTIENLEKVMPFENKSAPSERTQPKKPSKN